MMKPKRSRLERCKKAFHTAHDNGDHFLVAYDHAAGRDNRYTVFVWRVGRIAKIIGREIDLPLAREIIAAYQKKPVHGCDREGARTRGLMSSRGGGATPK